MRFLLPLTFSLAMVAACGDKDDTDTGTGTDTDGDTDTDNPNDTDTDEPVVTDEAECVDEGGACVLSGVYTETMTLTADKPWLLRSVVTIGDDGSDVTLKIQPGTTIYGESATGGVLVISRGANIIAEGTATEPITFTSDQAVGSRNRGDWGGVAINGYGTINACADGADPCEAEGEGGTGKYGGSDNADNSGVLKYVVIEYGGTEVSPDNEINGLGLQGVGSGTVIDYVQIHRNLDDGIELWGGAVDVKHLVVTSPGDDGIDWDLGYQGTIQYAIVEQASDAGNMGMETDGNADNFLATPVSAPTISNLTIIGDEGIAEDNFGFLMRRGSQPKAYNMAITSFSSGCLAIRDQATVDAFVTGSATLEGIVMDCGTPFEVVDSVAFAKDVFELNASNKVVADVKLDGWMPGAGSPLLGAGVAVTGGLEATDFVGAIGTEDWTAGWTVSSEK